MKRGKNQSKQSSRFGLRICPRYRESHYQELLRVSDDTDSLPQSWNEYQAYLENGLRACERADAEVYLVDVNVYDLIAYCAQNGYPMNAKSRADYSMLQAAIEDVEVRRIFCELMLQRHPEEFKRAIDETIDEFLNKRETTSTPWSKPLHRGSIRAVDLVNT